MENRVVEISSVVEHTNLPKQLMVTDDFEIGVQLAGGGNTVRVLLSPVTPAFLDTKEIGLKGIVQALVKRYNQLAPIIEFWQAHHQNKANRDETDWIAQIEINKNDPTAQELFKDWMDDLRERIPYPDGWEWFLCNERHPKFVKCDNKKDIAHAKQPET